MIQILNYVGNLKIKSIKSEKINNSFKLQFKSLKFSEFFEW